jgi:hypothetical protein
MITAHRIDALSAVTAWQLTAAFTDCSLRDYAGKGPLAGALRPVDEQSMRRASIIKRAG